MARRCGNCGETGHNRRTCTSFGDKYRAYRPVPQVRRGSSTRRCSYCDEMGHNRRTCPTLKSDYATFCASSRTMQTEIASLLSKTPVRKGTLLSWRENDYAIGDVEMVAVVIGFRWDRLNCLPQSGCAGWLNSPDYTWFKRPLIVKIIACKIVRLNDNCSDGPKTSASRLFKTRSLPLPWHLMGKEAYQRLSPRRYSMVIWSEIVAHNGWYTIHTDESSEPAAVPSGKVEEIDVVCPKANPRKQEGSRRLRQLSHISSAEAQGVETYFSR